MALPTQMVGGLISGLDTSNIIKQLMTIERRPLTMLETRIKEHQLKLQAYKAVNTVLQDFYSAAKAVSKSDLWSAYSVSSSEEAVLSAAVTADAEVGSYSFRVARLAQTAQYVSGGFATRDKTPVAPAGGEIRIDSGRSRVNLGTKVADLNGGRGIYRGAIRITDKSGASAVIDLSGAETVQDIIDAINSAEGVRVRASLKVDAATQTVAGDALTITDLSGGAGLL
ncbi:MAG: hypothetical protein N3A66_11220, partial [Planctomycetota bacterium]|nr:hypothetical protein [Planctomycetota bacterium]